jgi:hypothetical protein
MKSAEEWYGVIPVAVMKPTRLISKRDILEIQIDALKEAQSQYRNCGMPHTILNDLIIHLEAMAPK